MEVRYRNDLYGRYMLIEIPETIDTNQYSFRMLEKNKISGVLTGKERMEDGRGYWYIDINKKRTLLEEYKEKEMQLEDMVLIFQQIASILEELRTFLLSESMAVMDPEYIFRDIEDESLYILILPWNREERKLHPLAEFLLEKMSHRDENGVNAAYLFYRQQNQLNFSMYQFLSVLEKESILKRQKMNEQTADIASYMRTEEDSYRKAKERILVETFQDDFQEIETEQSRKVYSKGIAAIIFLALSIIFFICSFLPIISTLLRMSFRAVSVLMFLISFVVLCSRKKKIKQDLQERKKDDFSLQEMDIGMKETVFFEPYDKEEYLKLQWKERGRKKQFVLKDFPCTVGKMKEEVTLCISDISISRIHCKFVEKEGKVAIMDMNSTNGTFLNGLPVKNGEILEIEKNDEILIGKVRVFVV